MIHVLRILLLTLFLTALPSCEKLSVTSTSQQEYATEFIILYDNDHHGHFLPNQDGEYGMAARKTLVDQIRNAAGDTPVFYFSGGDINTGTPESRLLEAEPDIMGMNLLKVDAMAIGNHELDLPLTTLQKQSRQAQFLMLSANMYNKKDGQLHFPGHMFLERGPIKLGILGLTTPDTQKMVHPSVVENIGFHDPVATAQKLVPELKKQADIVVALTHLGHFPDGKHGLNAVDDVTLARQVPGINVIVGGHTQTAVCMLNTNHINDNFKAGDSCQPDKQGDAWIVQAQEWGKYLGELRLKAIYNGKGDFQRLELVSNRLIPINMKDANGKLIGEPIAQDPEMDALFAPYIKKSNALMNKRVAQLNGSLNGDRRVIRNQGSTLAQLVIQSQIEQVNADLGIVNGGGLRDGIAGGEVTMRDVWRVLPFDNEVVYIDLTGKELKDYLAKVTDVSGFSGGYPHFRGVSFRKNGSQVEDVVVTGQTRRAVVDGERYRLVLNSFLVMGGDRYPELAEHNTTQTNAADVFANYLIKNKAIDIVDYQPQQFLIK